MDRRAAICRRAATASDRRPHDFHDEGERAMATFFMFGRYTSSALGNASAERTRTVHEVVEQMGGKVKAIYALMGEYDVVIIVELPRMTEAMKVSMRLKKLTDISFFTAAAMPIEEFDQLIGEL
jgi:uncharacterized protein with GYD domain